MNAKMILTDLDYTLLHSDGSISGYTKQILKTCQSRGILIAIATARKTQAIVELAKRLDIPLDDIVSFGDDVNDMEMLRICGMGVAVSNAVADVKAAADCVAWSNDEEGVAHWIEKNILAAGT